jgi:hypothetical protein
VTRRERPDILGSSGLVGLVDMLLRTPVGRFEQQSNTKFSEEPTKRNALLSLTDLDVSGGRQIKVRSHSSQTFFGRVGGGRVEGRHHPSTQLRNFDTLLEQSRPRPQQTIVQPGFGAAGASERGTQDNKPQTSKVQTPKPPSPYISLPLGRAPEEAARDGMGWDGMGWDGLECRPGCISGPAIQTHAPPLTPHKFTVREPCETTGWGVGAVDARLQRGNCDTPHIITHHTPHKQHSLRTHSLGGRTQTYTLWCHMLCGCEV